MNNDNNNSNNHNLSSEFEDLLNHYDEQNKRELKDLVDISSKEKRAIDSSRNDRVKNFVLHIDDESLDYDEEEPWVNKGEVYFANRPATNKGNYEPVHRSSSVKAKVAKSKLKFNIENSKLWKSVSKGIDKDSKSYKQFKLVAPLLAILLAIAIIFSSIILSCLNDVFSFSKKDKVITVTIPTDASTKDIIRILDKKGLITNGAFCNFFVKTTKVMKYNFSDDESKNKVIKGIYNGTIDSVYLPGVYDLQRKMGVEGMLNSMKESQKGDETVKITFPEGWTVERFIKKLTDNEICDESLLRKSLQENNYEYDFMDELNKLSKDRYQRLEGYLYPSTYEFFVGESVSSIINRLLKTFDEKWTDEYQKCADALGYSRDQIITIASILEKEGADYEQMTLIASVLYNRLKNPTQYPSLQCDSTSDYVTNTVKPNVDNNSTALFYMNRYNTSSIVGLPAGPICNPGDDAIKAALHPAKTKYYYFQHDDNGKIYMAETVAQHRENSIAVAKANQGLIDE